jgi:hypothetical protein
MCAEKAGALDGGCGGSRAGGLLCYLKDSVQCGVDRCRGPGTVSLCAQLA